MVQSGATGISTANAIAVVFTPLLGVLILRPPKRQAGPGPVIRTFRRVLEAAMRAGTIDLADTLWSTVTADNFA